MSRRIPRFVVVFWLLVAAAAARGVVKAPHPPSSFYDKAVAVIVGKVTRIDAAGGRVDVSVRAIKGAAPGESIALKVQNLPDLLAAIKPDAPVVLFIGQRAGGSAIHVGDGWYFPQAAGAGKTNFIVAKDLAANLRQSYPGGTSALVKIVEELKAGNGKYSMLDEAQTNMFKGGTKDLGKAGGLKLPKLAGAVVMGNFGENPKAAFAIIVREGGIFRHTLDAVGAPAAAPEADFTRLTGEAITSYHRDKPGWLGGATAAALDCNGDGRTDVLINSSAGPMLLINRGFGCFFVNPDLGKTLGTALPPTAKWTAMDVNADRHDDLVEVSDDGKATAILNPPAGPGAGPTTQATR
jgi:hypothetical protein